MKNALYVYPFAYFIEKTPSQPEPAAGAALLSAETEDEVAVARLFERQPGIHEFKVAVTVGMGIVQCCPDGQNARVQLGVCFPQSAGEKQIGIVV